MITSLLSNQGFSVVACVCLFYILYKEMTGNQKAMEKFVKAINNNTRIIERLEILLKERGYLNEETDETEIRD